MEALHKEHLLACNDTPEQDNTLQNMTDVIYYAKIHGITENGKLDITYNHVKNAWSGEDEAMIIRGLIETHNIFDELMQLNYSLVDEQEFDYALNESLLRLGVMF